MSFAEFTRVIDMVRNMVDQLTFNSDDIINVLITEESLTSDMITEISAMMQNSKRRLYIVYKPKSASAAADSRRILPAHGYRRQEEFKDRNKSVGVGGKLHYYPNGWSAPMAAISTSILNHAYVMKENPARVINMVSF